LQTARLIFIDEITMMRRDELDAIVDKLDALRFRGAFQPSSRSRNDAAYTSLINSTARSAGAFVVAGNLAQLGPVMPQSDLATQIGYSLPKAHCWQRFRRMRLTGQMRMHDRDLHSAVHRIGYGDWPKLEGCNHTRVPQQRIHLPTRLFPAVAATDANIADIHEWAHGDPTIKRDATT
jgi:hypothetical protein